jgi:hypothetical protein
MEIDFHIISEYMSGGIGAFAVVAILVLGIIYKKKGADIDIRDLFSAQAAAPLVRAEAVEGDMAPNGRPALMSRETKESLKEMGKKIERIAKDLDTNKVEQKEFDKECERIDERMGATEARIQGELKLIKVTQHFQIKLLTETLKASNLRVPDLKAPGMEDPEFV